MEDLDTKMNRSCQGYTLGEIAGMVGGKVSGDPETRVFAARPFEEAGPGDITLAGNRKILSRLKESKAEAVIVPPGVTMDGRNLLETANPKAVFARILQKFTATNFEAEGISGLALVGKRCEIDPEVTVDAFVRIGDRVKIQEKVTISSGCSVGDDCFIGAGSLLNPNVTLYPGSILGERVIVHSGTVIGADGFGYVKDGEQQVKLPQSGNVQIGNDVEIGANSCIDRATFGSTVLENQVKIDNHVHIGHNCRIGEGTIIVGSVGISGSVTIGKNCIFAGQSGASDHVNIGDNVTVLAKTAVTKDVPSGMTVSGLHGRDHRGQIKTEAILNRLPQIYRDLKTIKKKLGLK